MKRFRSIKTDTVLFRIILFSFLLTTFSCTKAQDELPMIIHMSNDFEDNTTGQYLKGEWEQDWNHPPWANRLENAHIQLKKKSKVLRIDYKEGTYGLNPDDHSEPGNGIQFFSPIPDQPMTEIYMSYNVMFKPNFDFVLSGKLPGLNGGPNFNGTPAYEDGFMCGLAFSGQLMGTSRRGTLGFYLYHHDMPGEYGQVATWDHPYSSHSYFTFKTTEERWTNICIRLVLNTVNEEGKPGNYDGILEGYIDGKLMEQWTGLRFRNTEEISIDVAKIYSFFGGNTAEFAPTRDEWILLDDFILFTYAPGEGMPQGNVASTPGRNLDLPNLKQ